MALPDDLQLHRRLPARASTSPRRSSRSASRDRGAATPEPSRTAPASIPHLVIRTDGAARGNPGPASLGAALIDGSRADALDPTAPPGRDDLARPWASRPTTSPSTRASLRALELAERLGAREGRPVPRLEAHRRAAPRPLAGQGRQAHPALGGGEGDARRLPALVGDPRAAGPELDGGPARERGARPGRGRRPDARRPRAAGGAGGVAHVHDRLLRRLQHPRRAPGHAGAVPARRPLAGRAGRRRRGPRRRHRGGAQRPHDALGRPVHGRPQRAAVPPAVPPLARSRSTSSSSCSARTTSRRSSGATPHEIALGAGTLADLALDSGTGPDGAAPGVLLVAPPRLGS